MNHDASPAAQPPLRCLLCRGEALNVIWKRTGADVRALWRAIGRDLSEKAFGALTLEREVVQFECRACGFRFFDPSLAGGGEFYEALEQGEYYSERRPEFDFALGLCRHEHATSVLDVGGGEGAFLDRARDAGLATFAVELNPRAAGICARKGHSTLRKPLEEVSSAELNGGVDMLTLFQVIEHVPDPRAFLGHAAHLVKSRGLVIVAVPNNRGQHMLLPFDPANMPPHHVSRWRMGDLEVLGAHSGLAIAACGADALYGASIEEFWLQHNRLAAAIGHPPRPGSNWLPKTISFLYRKLGCRHYFPHRGLSIYVAYRKP